MIRCLIVIVSISLQIRTSSAQILEYSKLIEAINQRAKSSVFVERAPHSGSGTVFKVPFSDTTTAGIVLVLTAKHILEDRDSDGKVVMTNGRCLVYFNRRDHRPESRRYGLTQTWDSLDIAILQPIDKYRPFDEYDTYVPTISNIASHQDVKPGEVAFLAGFPLEIGANLSSHLNPVIQTGSIAYVDTIRNVVFVDIAVNQGNSGCPVYIVNQAGVVKLLGLVFQYNPANDQVLRLEKSGLGIADAADVLRDTTILKTMDTYFLKPSSPGFKLAPANSGLGKVVMLAPVIEDIRKKVQSK